MPDRAALDDRLARLRELIAAAARPGEPGADPDAVREAYGELVDELRDDAAAMAVLRPLGDEIRRLEADGTLPRALVARSTRRRGPTRP